MNRFDKAIQSLMSMNCSLFLVILALVLGIADQASAQSTAEVCRETRKVLEQYNNEKQETSLTLYFKTQETKVRDALSRLNSAIANRRLIAAEQLKNAIFTVQVETPRDANGDSKNPASWTVEERDALQRTVRDAMVRGLQKAANVSTDELEQRLARIQQQINLRGQKLDDLHCNEVNKTNTAPPSSEQNPLVGIWEGTSGVGGLEEEWDIKNNDGQWSVTGTWSRDGKEVGSFRGKDYEYKDGRLSFTQTINKVPIEGWKSGTKLVVWMNDGNMNFTWTTPSGEGGTVSERKKKTN